MHGETVKFS